MNPAFLKTGAAHHNWKGGLPRCLSCGKRISYGARRCRKHQFTAEVRSKLSSARKGVYIDEKHPQWKGDLASYRAVHLWMVRKFGKPQTCEGCSKPGLTGRKIHWANLDGKYTRDRRKWKRLCSKCHGALDAAGRRKAKRKGV